MNFEKNTYFGIDQKPSKNYNSLVNYYNAIITDSNKKIQMLNYRLSQTRNKKNVEYSEDAHKKIAFLKSKIKHCKKAVLFFTKQISK